MNETKTTELIAIRMTDTSLALFLAYAKDAGNWSGTPMVGGNVKSTKETRGNLTQLKKAGLIATFQSDGFDWLTFTAKGKEFAALMGIDIKGF